MSDPTATATAPLCVRISAPNAPNPLGRWRGKPPRLWTKDPVEVDVVDDPQGEGQISHASLARISADPYIKVQFAGGMSAGEAVSAEASALRAEIVALNDRIGRLEGDLASEHQSLIEERRVSSLAAENLGRELEQAQGEIANLRARLSEAQAPAAKRGR